MDFDIKKWLDDISEKIKAQFKNRILFIGYQGSYQRGEATPDSDIDMVVILDKLNFEDLKEYKKIIKSMSYCEKACGFVSGKSEITNWSKSDMFQFIYDTKSLYGNINEIITPMDETDIKNAVKTSAETLYHSACHSFLYDNDLKQSLCILYKMTFFILQADYFLQNNKYLPTKKDLFEQLKGEDKEILETCINKDLITNFTEQEIEVLYKRLIKWCSKKI